MNKFEDACSTGQKEENIMGKYEQDARQLIAYVGGKENIAAVSHCVPPFVGGNRRRESLYRCAGLKMFI